MPKTYFCTDLCVERLQDRMERRGQPQEKGDQMAEKNETPYENTHHETMHWGKGVKDENLNPCRGTIKQQTKTRGKAKCANY